MFKLKTYYIYFIIIVFLISIVFLLFRQNVNIESMQPQKNAIVVLTRGYEDKKKYDELISRNHAIYSIFYSKIPENNQTTYDIIILHEGNINREHQEYIQSKSPKLPIRFISVSFYTNNNKNHDICPSTELSDKFSNGYKNMCYFWSIDFLNYLENYEYIIRIDEDCILKKMDINIIENYKKQNIMFSSPFYQTEDDPNVIIGMDKLFNDFLKENKLQQKNKLRMPYTNFMIINIPFFKNNNIVQSILDKIKQTNCIFSNRWGDLPIWGYILSFFIDNAYILEDKSIIYLHASHNKVINNE